MQRKSWYKRFWAITLATALAVSVNVVTSFGQESGEEVALPERVGEEGCQEIPNTTSTFSKYNPSFLSVNGFASAGVHDRSEYVGTKAYRQVSTAAELVEAVYEAQSGSVKVIEIMKDINAGYNEARVNAKYMDSSKPTCVFLQESMNVGVSVINPLLQKAGGVSKIQIKKTDGLTIFSRYGASLYRTSFDIQDSANDIVIRNIKMDGSWQWDNHEEKLQKESGITYVKVNGDNVWIDHCEFTIAPDGCIDMESDAHGVTYSWCKFGMDPDEAVANETIHDSIMYLEDLYQKDLAAIQAGTQTAYSVDVNRGTRYRKMREAGATPEEIMQYTAYHSKVHLCGAGDKDVKTNPYLRLSLGYNLYNSIGQRVPMIRQGTGHMYNCYVDDSKHSALENKLQKVYGISNGVTGYTLSRCINARNGASIAADTCVFNGINGPLVGNELQGNDRANMTDVWANSFSNAYNHALIVNSRTTNTKGETYQGSSWDKEGENQFTADFKWHDKSTIKKWAWSSTVTTEFSGETYLGVFELDYGYDEKLPYEYQLVPLDDVEQVVKTYAGMGVYDMTPEQWCQVKYGADCGIEPAGENKVNIAGKIEFAEDLPEIYVGDEVTLETRTTPANVTDASYAWTVKNTNGIGTAKAQIDPETGVLKALAKGKITVTVKCTSLNGTSVSRSVELTILEGERPVQPDPPVVTAQAVSVRELSKGQVLEAGTKLEKLDYARLVISYLDLEGKEEKEEQGEAYKGVVIGAQESTGKWSVENVADSLVSKDGKTEYVVCITLKKSEEQTKPTDPPVEVVKGDLNGDGKVTLSEVTSLLKIALNIESVEEAAFDAADVNGDGKIGLDDVVLALKKSLNIPT